MSRMVLWKKTGQEGRGDTHGGDGQLGREEEEDRREDGEDETDDVGDPSENRSDWMRWGGRTGQLQGQLLGKSRATHERGWGQGSPEE